MMSSNVGKIKIKNLSELISIDESTTTSLLQDLISDNNAETPRSKGILESNKKAATSKNKKLKVHPKSALGFTTKTPGTGRKPRTGKKDPPPNQSRIDSFFQSASKASVVPSMCGATGSGGQTKVIAKKRLYLSNEDLNDHNNIANPESEDSLSAFDLKKGASKPKAFNDSGKADHSKINSHIEGKPLLTIDLCSDSDDDPPDGANQVKLSQKENLDDNSSGIKKDVKTKRKSVEKTPSVSKKLSLAATGKKNPQYSLSVETSEQTPQFSIPSEFATTKRRLQNLNSRNPSPLESTPMAWQSKKNPQNESNEKSKTSSSKLPKKRENNVTPLNLGKRKKSNVKKRKISFSSSDNTPLSIIKSNLESGKSTTPKMDLDGSASIIDEDSREGVFDMGVSKGNTSIRNEESSVSPKLEKKVEPMNPSETEESVRKRKPKIAPPFKIVNGTSFAVDAFCYGYISGVTHYFLSHYHADHYMGLTRKFAMPLYASDITARLIQAFTPIEEQYLNILELNVPTMIDGIEVTAIDANHCPGAVMFVFKLPNGQCMLHTGDFRASPEMESEPIFWNNDIHTIYLDTTYISDKYAFCTQYESFDKAFEIVAKFQEKHKEKKILYVCGSYVIGKEKFWMAIAQQFDLKKVWTEPNRRKALDAICDREINRYLSDDPMESDMHVIALGKLNYQSLKDYFEDFQHKFDVMLAFRPSGWEKNAKPQYRGLINIVGIEYSEHSSYEEMQRFVKYLKPEEVISTVPYGGYNSTRTPQVPLKWYKYDKLAGRKKNFQTSISSFLKTPGKDSPLANKLKTPARQTKHQTVNDKNIVEGVSPMKSTPMVLVGSSKDSSKDTIEEFEQTKSNEMHLPNIIPKEEDEDFILRNGSDNDILNIVCCIEISSDESQSSKSNAKQEVLDHSKENPPKSSHDVVSGKNSTKQETDVLVDDD